MSGGIEGSHMSTKCKVAAHPVALEAPCLSSLRAPDLAMGSLAPPEGLPGSPLEGVRAAGLVQRRC